jgi:hypothetical protein
MLRVTLFLVRNDPRLANSNVDDVPRVVGRLPKCASIGAHDNIRGIGP